METRGKVLRSSKFLKLFKESLNFLMRRIRIIKWRLFISVRIFFYSMALYRDT